MAVAGHRTDLFLNLRKETHTFLTGPKLYYSLTLEEFRKCFPRTCRDSPEIEQLHNMFMQHRVNVTAKVESLIRKAYTRMEQADVPINSGNTVEGMDLKEALNFLRERQAALQDEMVRLEKEIDEARGAITTCEHKLATLSLPSSSANAAVTAQDLASIPMLEELRKLLASADDTQRASSPVAM